jgi:hypothetical protein
MLSSCYNCSENFSKECLDKTHVTQDHPTITSAVCVAVTQPSLRKLPEGFRSVRRFWKYLN